MDERSLKKLHRMVNNRHADRSFEVIRVLCGRTRFKIVSLLKHRKAGLAVTDIAEALKISISRASHQLRILRHHKLVSAKGKNREVIYKLANHRLQKFLAL